MSALIEPLRLCNSTELFVVLQRYLLSAVEQALEASEPTQRIRVTTLPEAVMDGLCEALQSDSRWVARLLVSDEPNTPWKARATKIIELRNTLTKPLVVFIPAGLRTAAEDSLDIATFRELSLAGNFTTELVSHLQAHLPATIATSVSEILTYLRRERLVRNEDDVLYYLLSVIVNGASTASVGGSLYVFGLLPHFGLVNQSNSTFWLSRNYKIRQLLADLRQPLQARISRLPIEPNTVQAKLFGFLRERATEDVRHWAAEISSNASYICLALDNWRFTESGESSELRIVLDSLALPIQTEDEVGGTTRVPVLNLDGKEALKIGFRSIPSPNDVPAWKTYRVQLFLVDGEQPTIAYESNGFKKPGSKHRATRTLKLSDLQSLQEGTYFARVDGYDQDGATLTKPRPLDPSDPNSRAENESEYFLVVREGVDVVVPHQRTVEVASFIEAWVLATTKALSAEPAEAMPDHAKLAGGWTEPIGTTVRGDVHFKLDGPGVTGYSVVVSATLRRLELAALQAGDRCGALLVDFAGAKTLSDVEVKSASTDDLPTFPVAKQFLAARRACFSAIRDQYLSRSATDPANAVAIVETSDLLALGPAIEAYAEGYTSLSKSLVERPGDSDTRRIIRALAQLDIVELRWEPVLGDPGRAIVLSPLHPLRLLWHLQHARACQAALQAWSDKTAQTSSWPTFVGQLATDILPLNTPMILFDRKGRGYVEHAALSSHWTLYLPDRSEGASIDVALCRENARRLLCVKRATVASAAVGSAEIADRAFEYLQQHPYVEQLHINVFNPGDGQLITDALRRLEGLRRAAMPDGPSLRYSIQMFGGKGPIDLMGEAFESLLDPDRQVAEDDEFTLTPTNHLLPKLVFARNSIGTFTKSPKSFTAHLSILLEQFGSQSRLGQIAHLRRGSYVYGLVQDPETTLETHEFGFGWYKGLKPAARNNADRTETLIQHALVYTQRLQAAAASGEATTDDIAPVVALRLDSESTALIRLVHEHSDWVLTIDRNLGLDYFDSPSAPEDSGYLLDYAPEYLQEDRQRIMLTTRSTLELDGIIRPGIEKFGLRLSQGGERAVLETLRSLSGRLALRLLASETTCAEVVGLLLSRWLMEQSTLLQSRIVIPLDAHRGWFRPDKTTEASGKRADLLLIGFDCSRRVILVKIVEVKLREELTPASRSALYQEMREQAENTERHLRDLFDPDLYANPRADFVLRAKELSTALTFYMKRANRYGLVDGDELAIAARFVEDLDSGYSLHIEPLGVVFERQALGAHIEDDEHEFTVHRFGLDVAQQLLDGATRLVDAGSLEVVGNNEPLLPSSTNLVESDHDRVLRSFRSSVSGDLEQARGPMHVESGLPLQGGGDSGGEDIRRHEATPNISSRQLPAPEQNRASNPTTVSEDDPGKEITEHAAKTLMPDILLGAHELTPQYGILGRYGQSSVAVDLTGCNTFSLFGVQGFGKSYTLGVVAEMATTQVDGINELPSPLATVIFHYHKSDAYSPEFATAVAPNSKENEIARLLEEYGARPKGLTDMVLLTPEGKLQDRRREFPQLDVQPIKFGSGELGAESWKFLLGAYGNDSLYVKQIVSLMRRHREALTFNALKDEIAKADLPTQARRLAEDRLALAEPYIDDSVRLMDLIRPGRTIIVDLRDPWIEKDEALGLFVVMMKIFAGARHQGKSFNKLVVFDEAHKYISESELVDQVVQTIREMRHQATSVVIASQDPLSVPRAVIELTSVLLLHRMTSPQWLKHLKGAISALDDITESHLAGLKPGEALVWAQRSTDPRFTQRPYKINIRPRFSLHGGGTKTAVSGYSVR